MAGEAGPVPDASFEGCGPWSEVHAVAASNATAMANATLGLRTPGRTATAKQFTCAFVEKKSLSI